MSINRSDNRSTRAERKTRKRKREDAILDLPDGLEENSKPIVASTQKASKKGKHGKPIEGDAFDDIISRNASHEPQAINKSKEGILDDIPNRMRIEESRDRPIAPQHTISKAITLSEVADDKTMGVTETVMGSFLVNEHQVHKKSKKGRKAARKAAASNEVAVSPHHTTEICEERAKSGESKKKNRNTEKKLGGLKDNGSVDEAKDKAPRFIVFIGNLPFSATTETIQKHFSAVQPKSIRNLTQKDKPMKSRGCAFVEFDGYDRMKSCLKSFHHSIFDDGISASRKINVELTAGGGGNKKNRHNKITEKNQKLNEERIRRTHEDKARQAKNGLAIEHNDVHPSRRAQVSNVS